MIGSIFWILVMLFKLYQDIWRIIYYFDFFGIIEHLFMLMVPVSLLLLAINLTRSSSNNISNETSEIDATYSKQPISQEKSNSGEMTIGNWILNQFLASLPIAGLIIIIVWATDKNNVTRKNWAIAKLIWSGIITFLAMIIGLIVLLSNM